MLLALIDDGPDSASSCFCSDELLVLVLLVRCCMMELIISRWITRMLLLCNRSVLRDGTPRKASGSMNARREFELKSRIWSAGRSQKAVRSINSMSGQLLRNNDSIGVWTKSPVEIWVKKLLPICRIRRRFNDCSAIDGTWFRWLWSRNSSSNRSNPTKALLLMTDMWLNERISWRSPVMDANTPPDRWEMLFRPRFRTCIFDICVSIHPTWHESVCRFAEGHGVREAKCQSVASEESVDRVMRRRMRRKRKESGKRDARRKERRRRRRALKRTVMDRKVERRKIHTERTGSERRIHMDRMGNRSETLNRKHRYCTHSFWLLLSLASSSHCLPTGYRVTYASVTHSLQFCSQKSLGMTRSNGLL